ncbi:MAG: SCO family protein [Chloroflexi bacterium]|nr:SCO family protein [Chloroflexota bacterium]
MIAQGAGRLPQVRTYKWSWLFYGAIALVAAGIIAFATLRPIQVLPRITLAPGFALTDQDGHSLTNEDLRGQIVLYNFTYTRCQAPCAQTSPIMRGVQNQLSSVITDGVTITLVTILFDSELDKPDTLRAYAKELEADTARWRFLTGDANRVKYVIGDGFNVYYAPNASGTFDFDPVFVLVDGWGIVRAIYRHQLPTSERIIRDLGVIVQEIKNSTGVGKYAYEAAHLFLCYPP